MFRARYNESCSSNIMDFFNEDRSIVIKEGVSSIANFAALKKENDEILIPGRL